MYTYNFPHLPTPSLRKYHNARVLKLNTYFLRDQCNLREEIRSKMQSGTYKESIYYYYRLFTTPSLSINLYTLIHSLPLLNLLHSTLKYLLRILNLQSSELFRVCNREVRKGLGFWNGRTKTWKGRISVEFWIRLESLVMGSRELKVSND